MPDVFLLRGFALPAETEIIRAIHNITLTHPLRHMTTPGGYTMSVAMTNCGEYGWMSDQKGYRYATTDPLNNTAWPAMPGAFLALAQSAAQQAGFSHFNPNACLINCYKPGSKMSLHQDKDEQDFSNPIVSVSLGIPATFMFGGLQRQDPTENILLHHGDVVVWGGTRRLAFHGIKPLKENHHPVLGSKRYNLTFRKAV